MKSVFLCGFMGCGKSTVGLALAPLLGMKYLDMDSYIENLAGESVQDIFKFHGESRFRSFEHTAAREISKMGGLVVATGGGAVLSDANAAAFKSCGMIVLIDVPFEIITARLEYDTTRPLLQSPDKISVMRSLYDMRMPLYRAVCDFSVTNADDRPETLVARDIASRPEIKGL
jgi:shikimate kinase